ncbi:hypothetical protein ACFQ0D_27695, partial [Micromonospora zhanjiangensis]
MQSRDYPDAEADELEELDPALVSSTGHGPVARFQAPQPIRGRHTPSTPAPRRPAAEHPDIDSPFLDLFGGPVPRPGPGNGHPAARPPLIPPTQRRPGP